MKAFKFLKSSLVNKHQNHNIFNQEHISNINLSAPKERLSKNYLYTNTFLPLVSNNKEIKDTETYFSGFVVAYHYSMDQFLTITSSIKRKFSAHGNCTADTITRYKESLSVKRDIESLRTSFEKVISCSQESLFFNLDKNAYADNQMQELWIGYVYGYKAAQERVIEICNQLEKEVNNNIVKPETQYTRFWDFIAVEMIPVEEISQNAQALQKVS